MCPRNSEGVDLEELTILALDSGSPKLTVFGGNGKGIKAIHELLIEFWDRVAVGGFGKKQANLKLFAEHLDSIDKIGDLEKSGKISKVEAESLKRALVRAVGDVASVGAITTEQEGVFSREFPSIAYSQQRLLAAPKLSDLEYYDEEVAHDI